jgi:hypothetical protein
MPLLPLGLTTLPLFSPTTSRRPTTLHRGRPAPSPSNARPMRRPPDPAQTIVALGRQVPGQSRRGDGARRILLHQSGTSAAAAGCARSAIRRSWCPRRRCRRCPRPAASRAGADTGSPRTASAWTGTYGRRPRCRWRQRWAVEGVAVVLPCREAGRRNGRSGRSRRPTGLVVSAVVLSMRMSTTLGVEG